jgi:hypothetical protein
VGQLVREEALTVARTGPVLPVAEEDVVAGGEGDRAELSVQHVGFRSGVDTHLAEVGTEPVLHARSDRAIERRTTSFRPADAAFDHPVDAAPRRAGEIGRRPEDAGVGRRPGGYPSIAVVRRVPADSLQHLLRHAVGLVFARVSRGADDQLRLNDARAPADRGRRYGTLFGVLPVRLMLVHVDSPK